MEAWTTRSLSESSADVASSNKRILGCFRSALQTRMRETRAYADAVAMMRLQQ